MKYVWDLLKETLRPVVYFIKSMMGYLPDVIECVIPYVMLWVGVALYEKRGAFLLGGELFIPLVAFFIVGIFRTLANRMNVGRRIPIPRERFTSVDEDGEVSIEINRTQELILYVADLEDWLERKGYTR